MNDPEQGKLELKLKGELSGDMLQFVLELYSYKLNTTFNITFDGKKTASTPDLVDYAVQVLGSYSRTSLSIKGDSVGSEYPNGGIELEYVGVNCVKFKSFYLSFPNTSTGASDTRSIDAPAIPLIVKGDEMLLDTVRAKVVKSKQDTAQLVMYGKIKGGELTLNMQLTTAGKNAVYIYKGDRKSVVGLIETLTIAGDAVVVQPEFENATESPRKVAFYVKAGTTNDKKKLVPTFKISAGSKIFQRGSKDPFVPGTEVDFSTTKSFTVTAESGRNTTYEIECLEWNEYDFGTEFTTWVKKNLPEEEAEEDYNVYAEPANGWATSNEGVRWIKMIFSDLYAQDAPYPVNASDGKVGIGAKLVTLNTEGRAGFPPYMPAVPKVTSGTVFSGTFVVNISNTLKSTRFGYPCTKKPVRLTGSYKYTPGSVFYVCPDPVKADEVTIDSERRDAPAINAVLYEVENYAFEYLDGTNLLTARNIVAIASLKDESAKAQFTDFNIEFDFKGKQFDPNKKYKLAIVCSSSKWGDSFTGAPGSTLIVDDLKVVF